MWLICYAPGVRKKESVSTRPTISIVGPGNLGSALALTLVAAGYRVESFAVRRGSKHRKQAGALARRIGAQLVELSKESRLAGDIVWITVPDDAIAQVARVLAKSGEWQGKTVFHSSGALTSDELGALRTTGTHVATVHPMMTFVRGAVPDMKDVAFALEGDAVAVRTARSIVTKLAGKPFVIRKENKVLYHVFGSFASPLVIALMATMEEVALAAGIRKKDIPNVVLPLLTRTWGNYLVHGAASAFTGPLARGDVATVQKHLAALQNLPQPSNVYLALASSALRSLPAKNRKRLMRVMLEQR
jgi:predicted short-subunit dehydrogenase-like oxidoreductase (DUF2520 family)